MKFVHHVVSTLTSGDRAHPLKILPNKVKNHFHPAGSARHPLSINYKVTSDIYTLATIHKQLSCTHFVDQLNKCLINIHPQKPLAGQKQPGIYNNALVFCVAKETGLFSMPKKKLWMQLKDQEREIECFLPPGYELPSKWINMSAAWSKLNSGTVHYPQVSSHHSWLCPVKL